MTLKTEIKVHDTRSDKDRLYAVDQALSIVQSELRALEHDEDELSYLMEVLRLGVRRALHDDLGNAELEGLPCDGQTH
jgi:hypothetical protein